MPYIRPDKISSISFVRNRYRGSGFTLKGFSFNPKNPLYMVSESLALSRYFHFVPAVISLCLSPQRACTCLAKISLRYRSTSGLACHWKLRNAWCAVDLEPQFGLLQIAMLEPWICA